MRFSKTLNYIENVWDRLNILAPNSKFFKRKSPCKSAFQNKLFTDVSDPADHSESPTVSVSKRICCVVLNTLCQTTNDRGEERNAGNDKEEMRSIIPYFKPMKTSKLRLCQ